MKLFQYILIPSVCIASILAACNDDHEPIGPEEPETETSYPNRYYIDPENGAHYNTGHSPSQAWESVERFTEKPWGPGDTILIKRGTVWNGAIELRGSGEPGKPIVLCSYGDDDLPLPEINAEGKKDQAILIKNVQYWEIHDLKITNKGEDIAPRRAGIQITADNIPGGVMNHIHIKRCIIADVNGSKTHHNGGGVGIGYYNVIESENPSNFNNLVVEDCQIINCQRDGLTGYLTTGDRSKRKANTNVVFRGNLFEGVPGDQIIINGCDGAIVENNVIRKCAPGDFSPEWLETDFRAEAAAAVWCIHSDETVFRYNIVQDHKATWDGQAFDCDQNCMNTLFEYNITYNNHGGFFLLCPADYYFNNGYAPSTGTIVRYNISINDGVRDYLKEDGTRLASTVDVVGRVVDFHFYNNTIIKTRSAASNADNSAFTFNSLTNHEQSMIISNNIFYNTTGEYNEFCRQDFDSPTENHTIVFQNNCVYGYSTPVPGSGEYNSGNITLDPQFIKLIENFLSNNELIDKEEVLNGLKLATGSPCIGTGTTISDGGFFPLTKDLWGNPIKSPNNMGAYNH